MLGTQGYIAPEIIQDKGYKGEPVDMFTIGVILFTIISQHPPFKNATANDKHYRLLVNKPDLYWKYQCRIKQEGEDFYSEEVKDLITKLLKFKPENRVTMEEALEHPWLQGPVPSEQEMYDNFKQRKAQLIQMGEVAELDE